MSKRLNDKISFLNKDQQQEEAVFDSWSIHKILLGREWGKVRERKEEGDEKG